MSLKKTAIWLTILAFIVKLSGFLRESIIAREFGVSHLTDGYILAFSFISLAMDMISGGFNNVFLPLYVSHFKMNAKQTERNANGVMNFTALLFLVITVIGYFFVPDIVPFIYGHMAPQTEKVAVAITQFFFLFMSLVALSGILDSYLQAHRVFVPSQFAKLVQPLTSALFALVFSSYWGINSLAYGFIIGTFIGVVIQFSYLYRTGFRWQPTLHVDATFRKTFLVLLIPSLLNSVVSQTNLFVDKAFASSIPGAATYLNYASLMTSVPHNIYATSIAAIIFTLLSEQLDDPEKFQDIFYTGMQISLVTLLPITAGIYLVGQEAIAFLFQRGKFTAMDTHYTYMALVCFLPIIVTQGMQYIVSKAMYALGKTKIIFRVTVTTILLNALLDWILIKPLGYKGLALSSSIVSFYYLIVTAIVIYKDFHPSQKVRLFRLIVKALPPTIVMSVVLIAIKETLPLYHLYPLWQILILVPLGVVFYVAGLYLFYREGFYQMLNFLKRKKRAV
ncbi:murein biosynthesis integral membrane protein MurJ [Bacillus smithii]|uniref:Integral membrane protein MviN n=1 Tax=Bacillus smithii 7_3_47FAA TaxID=665952 RepID=G9QIC7_9BACI|nr:lipid II flippase MurJ [Bacillus smithii]EHL79098.1 integral membrane protein MviN [Bacillus smithii 7_3_47FAA]